VLYSGIPAPWEGRPSPALLSATPSRPANHRDLPADRGPGPIYYAHLNTAARPRRTAADFARNSHQPLDYTSQYIDVDFTPSTRSASGFLTPPSEYSNLRVSSPAIPMGGKLTVTADVANTGKVEAEEIVQLYTRDLSASGQPPGQGTEGFRRVRLAPGEKKSVEFTLGTSDLAFLQRPHATRHRAGRVSRVDRSGLRPRLRGEFRVTE